MIRAKIWFIYAAIAVFLASAVVGICGALGWLHLSDAVTITAFIGPCLGIVAALVKAEHIFNDPEAVMRLKEQHHEQTFEAKMKQREQERNIRESYEQKMAEMKADADNMLFAAQEIDTSQKAQLCEAHTNEKAQMEKGHAEKLEAERKIANERIAKLKAEVADIRERLWKYEPPIIPHTPPPKWELPSNPYLEPPK